MPDIILFDLGDTLIYRKESHFDLDVKLIREITGLDKRIISKTISRRVDKFPGIYKFWKDNDYCKSLVDEDVYNKKFFKLVFNDICKIKLLNKFIIMRNKQQRYFLFNNVKHYLSALKKRNYKLGVATNGRPSRRRILENLEIDYYFNPKLIFISDEIGLSKPDREFFEYTQKKFHNDRFYLCDDEERNIEQAKNLGWKTIKINHMTTGLSVLNKLLKNT